ncbi:MAG TPA: hypothetical protein VNO30_01660 [Kofleriaceae bacterium]|nr:hypothetical protein [Kofleriaceae bacterium]
MATSRRQRPPDIAGRPTATSWAQRATEGETARAEAIEAIETSELRVGVLFGDEDSD